MAIKPLILLFAWGFMAVPFSACIAADSLVLSSPNDDSHSEVAKPVFFWRANQEAKRYEVFIDNAKGGDVPAAPGPVMNFAPIEALSVGIHKWHVKAMLSTGEELSSPVFTLTIDHDAGWPEWAIGPFVRYGSNPLFGPQGKDWESVNAFNPGVIFDKGRYRMLYRAQGRAWPSRIGYAESIDGVSFTRNPDPLINMTEPFEKNYGLEDARFFKYQDTYYAFYTGNNPGGGIALCEATSANGTDWTKLGVIAGHTKNGAMICDPNGMPIKINGKFSMYIGNSKVNVCYSDDLVHWGPPSPINLNFPAGWVGPYEPCIAIANHSSSRPDDIVLFIAGTLNGKGKWFYGISELLFLKKDLTTKADQLGDCIMKPIESYEDGQNKKCLWMHCLIQHGRQWMMYYGAGDRYVGLATAPVK